MRKFMGLTKRNLLIYFKDWTAILFSLLTSLIILVLYMLFLKGTFESSMDSALSQAGSIADLISSKDTEAFVNAMLLVGMMGSALITVPYSCLTTIVKDRENKIDYDISATPVKRWQIIFSYFVAAALSASIITGILLTAGILILSINGGLGLSSGDVFKAYAAVILGSVSSTAFFMMIMQLFKTSQSSNAFFGLLSAAAGFVIGAYIPVSQFSDGIQTFCNIFPATHVTIVIRNVLMRGVLENFDASTGGIDNGAFTGALREIFTFNAKMLGNDLKISSSVIYILIFTLVSLIAMIFIYSKTYRRN